jgi:GNAT superfamily N-acetyltransferase
MVPITISKAFEDDATALVALTREIGYDTSNDDGRKRLRNLLAREDHAVFVARSTEGGLLGWVHVHITLRVELNPFAELGGFAVADEYRGRGIGTMLLVHAEDWAARKGMATLRVRSRQERMEAHQLYRHMGFTMTKEQLMFEKRLDGTDLHG